MKKSGGSPRTGALWMAALSVLLAWLPAVGAFLAGMVGARKAGSRGAGLLVALAGSVVWAAGLYLASRLQVQVGKTQVGLGPLAFLAPMYGASLLGGGLAAVAGPPRVLGSLVALAGVGYTGLQAREIWKFAASVLPERPQPSETAALPPESRCSENLRQLYGALQLYAGSWDDTLPPAENWSSALAEQGIDEEALRCPDAPPGTQGYAMNSEVGGKRISEIASPAGTPLLFDSTLTGPNAHDNLSSLPSPGRHQGKNYVLFADGQVGSR